MTTTFNTKTTQLPIVTLAIILSASALLCTSCGGGNDKPATATVDSTKASFKILGTWVSTDNPDNKAVFTADSVSQMDGAHVPETFKYTWINEQEMEIFNSKTGKKEPVKVTITGDSLTLTVKGEEAKLIREGAVTATNTITPANTDTTTTATSTTVQPPMTEEVKAFKNTLAGNWADASEKVIFTDSEISFYMINGSPNPFLVWKYFAVDEKTVEITDEHGGKSKATMIFEDNNNTLKWKDKMGDFTYKRKVE